MQYLFILGFILFSLSAESTFFIFEMVKSSDIMTNLLRFDIFVGEFKLHWRHYVIFRIITLEKCMKTLIPPTVG